MSATSTAPERNAIGAMRRLFELLTLMLISVLFAQCGGGGDGGGSPAAVTVATVRVTPTAVGLGVGQTVVLRAEALAADGAVLLGKTFLFGSSNAAVATVSVASAGADTATVKGMAVGTTTITVTVDGKTSASGITVTGASLDDILVTGRVVDGETQIGIANADVAYHTDNRQGGATSTSGDGSFSFRFPGDARSGVYVVTATASAAGYVTTRLGGGQASQTGNNQIETIQLVRTSATSNGAISGAVSNVRDGDVIAGASLRLERGQGSTIGGLVASTTSDAQGRYSFTGLAAGTYTVYASANGFTYGSRTAITVSTGAVRQQDVGLSPLGGDPEVRIVLNWGTAPPAPADLDAHLTGPNAPGSTGRFHAYFLNRLAAGAAPFAGLDRDDRDGSGPETITLTRFNGGVYRFSVHDYTNRSSAPTEELGRSGATVQVIAGLRTYTFYVPVKPGNLWTVFEMSGDIANPTLTERGEMGVTADFNSIP